MKTEIYSEQAKGWPQSGNVILANYDEETITVYQAYRPEIGNFGIENQYFGGAFRLTRMSWIKPNFLWMMYRCGWASKPGQEVVLGVRMLRSGFDQILREAVHSSYSAKHYESHEQWKQMGSRSDVRLQWDPDHSPTGGKLERRAIQLGLRGEVLRNYSREWIVSITDMTPFVVEQRALIEFPDQLRTPVESVYPAPDDVKEKLELVEGTQSESPVIL